MINFIALTTLYFSYAAILDFFTNRDSPNKDYALSITFSSAGLFVSSFFSFIPSLVIIGIATLGWVLTYGYLSYCFANRFPKRKSLQ